MWKLVFTVVHIFIVSVFVSANSDEKTNAVLYTSLGRRPQSSNILNYGGKTYYFSTVVKANFYGAHHFCRQQGMQLLTINNELENRKISQFAELIGQGDEKFWTSGTDLAKPKTFIWLSNGNTFAYTRWAPYEPTGYSVTKKQVENCVALTGPKISKDFVWNDRYCLDELYFICEKYDNDCKDS